MSDKKIEKRSCDRFAIPGATVSYKKKGFFFSSNDYGEEQCPVLDLSRGGIRFLSKELLRQNLRLSLKISVPDEDTPLSLEGRVVWRFHPHGEGYMRQIGVKFNPYGRRKGENDPETLSRIKDWEEKYSG